MNKFFNLLTIALFAIAVFASVPVFAAETRGDSGSYVAIHEAESSSHYQTRENNAKTPCVVEGRSSAPLFIGAGVP